MKSYSKFIQVIAFTGVVFFILAGTGYNIVHYCCDSCESVGIEYLSTHSCLDVHHAEHSDAYGFKTIDFSESSECCNHNSQSTATDIQNGQKINNCQVNEGHCELNRLELNDYSVSGIVHLQPNVAVIDLPVAVLPLKQLMGILTDPLVHYPPPEPAASLGRLLLAQKSVLVI